ncbi:hypothetical protein Dimus_038828 [Dionaea muscipula]
MNQNFIIGLKNNTKKFTNLHIKGKKKITHYASLAPLIVVSLPVSSYSSEVSCVGNSYLFYAALVQSSRHACTSIFSGVREELLSVRIFSPTLNACSTTTVEIGQTKISFVIVANTEN